MSEEEKTYDLPETIFLRFQKRNGWEFSTLTEKISVGQGGSGRTPFVIKIDMPDMFMVNLAFTLAGHPNCPTEDIDSISVNHIQIANPSLKGTSRKTLRDKPVFPLQDSPGGSIGILYNWPMDYPPLFMEGQQLIIQGHVPAPCTFRFMVAGWSPREQNCPDHPENQPAKDSEPEQQSPDESKP